MKIFSLKKGLVALLVLEAVIITLVTAVFMFKLYNIYTNLIYNESALVLNLHHRRQTLRDRNSFL